MSILSTLLIAFLSAALGCLLGGLISSLCVDWYHIPGREGASGFFILGFALLGAALGAVVGFLTSRLLAGTADPAFWRNLGSALAVVIILASTTGVLARLFADVAPTIGGEALLLAIEVRLPEGSNSPQTETDEGFLCLHSVPYFSHVVRASQKGVLWKKDARMVDGFWNVPGVVEIFTHRGKRILEVARNENASEFFEIRVPAFPRRSNLEWSEWLPRVCRDKSGTAVVSKNELTYRFRVQLRSTPVRSETVGPFTVLTRVNGIFEQTVNNKPALAASSQFEVLFEGKPLEIQAKPESPGPTKHPLGLADTVAVVAGMNPGLIVHTGASSETPRTLLARVEGGQVKYDLIDDHPSFIPPRELTSDPQRFKVARLHSPVKGWLDWKTFDHEGVFLFGHAVLDTQAVRIYSIKGESPFLPIPSVPPLGLSPDRRSFISYAYAENSADKPVLAVNDFVENRVYALPIDPARMRYANFAALDPEWVKHHFVWEPDADEIDRLVERKDFVPIPYHGEISVESGGKHIFQMEPAGDSLRQAVMSFLVKEFAAKRIPCEPTAYEQSLQTNDGIVKVRASEQFSGVTLTVEQEGVGTRLFERITSQIDAQLATGKYDSLFGYGTSSYRH